LQVRPGGEQLVGEARLAGARADERLADGDEREVLGLRRRWPPALRRRLLGAAAGTGDGVEQLARAAALGGRADAADPPEVLVGGGSAAGDLDEPGVAQHALHRTVCPLGRPLPPLDELAGDGP